MEKKKEEEEEEDLEQKKKWPENVFGRGETSSTRQKWPFSVTHRHPFQGKNNMILL